MSDSEPPVPAATQRFFTPSRIVVYGVLGLLLLSVGWDRLVARKAVANARTKVERLNTEINAAPVARVLTAAEVQESIGRPPSSTEQDGQYTVETYSWVSGLPWRTHKYFVVYSAGGRFLTHFEYERPLMNEFAPSAPVVPQGEEPSGDLPGGGPPGVGGGPPGVGGGPPGVGGGPPGGRRSGRGGQPPRSTEGNGTADEDETATTDEGDVDDGSSVPPSAETPGV